MLADTFSVTVAYEYHFIYFIYCIHEYYVIYKTAYNNTMTSGLHVYRLYRIERRQYNKNQFKR